MLYYDLCFQRCAMAGWGWKWSSLSKALPTPLQLSLQSGSGQSQSSICTQWRRKAPKERISTISRKTCPELTPIDLLKPASQDGGFQREAASADSSPLKRLEFLYVLLSLHCKQIPPSYLFHAISVRRILRRRTNYLVVSYDALHPHFLGIVVELDSCVSIPILGDNFKILSKVLGSAAPGAADHTAQLLTWICHRTNAPNLKMVCSRKASACRA